MRRHETPPAIASALASYAPRRIERILDPSVGNGILLRPFLRRARTSSLQLVAIDTDSRPLKRLKHKFELGLGKRLKIINADFLKWVCAFLERNREARFDCIVMNPPFAARRRAWKSLREIEALLAGDGLPRLGPVEAGFVLGAIALLRPGGRFLAVLPASLISSPGLAWVRELMAESGTIRHVHELPRFTFPKIESRIYLVVYEKGTRAKTTHLLNHDLAEPEEMVVEEGAPRLDFGYHNAAVKIRRLKERRSLGWQPLGSLATIWRGTEHTPGISKAVVHTGNYRDGFWRSGEDPVSSRASAIGRRIRAGDVVVKRVSRHCARSFGLADGIRGALGSDCVLIVRPRTAIRGIRLLFAIRCLMALDFGPALLERGTGASYLAQGELGDFAVPFALSERYGAYFRSYVAAVRRRSFATMRKVEAQVSRRLSKFCG